MSWASLAVKEIKAIRQENRNKLRGCAQSMVNALFWNAWLHSARMAGTEEGNSNGHLSWRILALETSWCRMALPLPPPFCA